MALQEYQVLQAANKLENDCRRIFEVGFSPQLPVGREDLPVLDQLLPDDSSHDILAKAVVQLGEVGVGVVEAVQQHLGHLPLLLPYQPERVGQFVIRCK